MPRLVVLATLIVLIAAAPAGAAPQPRLPVPGHQDVNGDGRDDIVFGTPGPLFGSQPPLPVRLLTVFGKADRALVDVRTPGPWGQTIDGPFGQLASGDIVGDFNGDERADILARYESGEKAVLPGQSTGGSVHAEALPAALRLRSASDAAGAGDVNGDGLDDLVVFDADDTSPKRKDRIGLVFGSRTPATVDVAQGQLATRFKVPRGPRRTDGDFYVAGIGDLDRDGIDDVAVSADWVPERTCRDDRTYGVLCDGRVWIVYGRRGWPAQIDVSKLGRREGFAIKPRTSIAHGGGFVRLGRAAAAGDIDGDGYQDMVFRVSESVFRPQSVVVWGSPRRRTRPLRLSARTSRIRDVRYNGVTPIGDFDGDGRADLLGRPDPVLDEGGDGTTFRTFVLRGRRWSGARGTAPRRARDGFVLFRRVGDFMRAGDVNGDGLSDIFATPNLREPGTGFAVFGDPSRKRVHVDRPSFRGFRYGVPE